MGNFRKKKGSESAKYFNKMRKFRRKQEAIMDTYAYIFDYYKNNKLSFDDLIDAYYSANYGTKYFSSGIAEIMIGIVAGLASSFIFSISTDFSLFEGGGSATINTVVNIITIVAITTIVIVPIGFGLAFLIFKFLKAAISFYSNDYYNFIAPYELKVIEHKLLKIYHFKPSRGFQGGELAAPNANHVSPEPQKNLPSELLGDKRRLLAYYDLMTGKEQGELLGDMKNITKGR